MNTRVKIPRTYLIEKIKEAIAEETAKAEAVMVEHREKVKKVVPDVLKGVNDFAAKLNAMSEDELVEFIIKKSGHYREAFAISSLVDVPGRPWGYNDEYDKQQLRILEASVDDEISVSTRDGLYQYL